ncbi:hypothetical protein LTR95_010920 [Oleoguttula sp. CCFEE 5521]
MPGPRQQRAENEEQGQTRTATAARRGSVVEAGRRPPIADRLQGGARDAGQLQHTYQPQYGSPSSDRYQPTAGDGGAGNSAPRIIRPTVAAGTSAEAVAAQVGQLTLQSRHDNDPHDANSEEPASSRIVAARRKQIATILLRDHGVGASDMRQVVDYVQDGHGYAAAVRIHKLVQNGRTMNNAIRISELMDEGHNAVVAARIRHLEETGRSTQNAVTMAKLMVFKGVSEEVAESTTSFVLAGLVAEEALKIARLRDRGWDRGNMEVVRRLLASDYTTAEAISITHRIRTERIGLELAIEREKGTAS